MNQVYLEASCLNIKLAKCARCSKLFNKILSEVCNNCQPEEDTDFSRIQDILSRENHLKAEEVAEAAGVGLDCVLRMLREGRIDNVAHESSAACGRCGAPAISMSKRLCQRCLVNLDKECAQAIHDLRERMVVSKDGSDMNAVMAAVESRRASRKREGRETERPKSLTQVKSTGHGMVVVPEQLRRK